MGEQDLSIDPVTKRRRSERGAADAHQNDNYTRHTEISETSRDYSRPHTIPKQDFEESTGRNHEEACAEFDRNEQARQEQQARELAALSLR